MTAIVLTDDASSKRRQPNHRLGRKGRIVVVILASLVLVGGAVATALWLDGTLNQVGQGAAKGALRAMNLGGTASQSAARVASERDVAMGSLTVAQLNDVLPEYHWVDGSTNVPPSAGQRTVVGVAPASDHVLTAVQLGAKSTSGLCVFGLSVSSLSDPIVTVDQLPGIGTYVLMSGKSSTCRADDAPVTGWVAYQG